MTVPESGTVLITYHFSGFVLGGDPPTSFRAGIAIDDDACGTVIADTHVYGSVGPFLGSDMGTASGSYVAAMTAGTHDVTLCVQTFPTAFIGAGVARHAASGLQVVFTGV